MATLYSSNFDSDTTGAAPSGWYGVFKVQAHSAAAVSGSNAMAAFGESDGSLGNFRGISARTQANYLIKQKAQFNGANLLLQSLMHGDDQNSDIVTRNAYHLHVTAASSTSISVGLRRAISTIWDASYQATGSHTVSTATGDIICQRLVVDGLSVKYTVWNETKESEPTTPTLTYTDSTQRAAGFLYVIYNNGAGTTATGFDDVTITDVVSGGGDTTAPTLTGSITISAKTTTSYTASWSAGSDNVAVTGYQYRIASGSWVDAGNVLTVNITGRTPGATETFEVRAYDAAGNFSTPALSTSVTLNSAGTIAIPAVRDWSTGNLKTGESGVQVDIHNISTGALVVRKTGQTTHGTTGVCIVTDAAITAGTTYEVVTRFADGSKGMWDYTAT